jgi:hypothetical protein
MWLINMTQVIRNPGVVPDSRFTDSNTDINVVFEQSYEEYKLKESELSAMDHDQTHRCYMVHSLLTMAGNEMRSFVDMLSRRAGYLFVTNNAERYYEQFGSDWSRVARLGAGVAGMGSQEECVCCCIVLAS